MSLRTTLHSIAGLGLRWRAMPTPETHTEAGVLAHATRFDPVAHDIADEIAYPGRRHADERLFRHELALYLQEQVLLRENYDALLDRLLRAERR